MINFFKSLISNFKEKSLAYKILIGLVLLFYILIISLTFIKINYATTTPGAINSVTSVIEVDSDYTSGRVYTVSVYEHRKVNVLHYLIANLSDNVEITKFDPETYPSKSENDIRGRLMKENSIDYSLILAYREAGKINEDVNIVHNFEGMVVSQLFEQADELIQLEDLITHVEGERIVSKDHFYELVDDVFASPKENIEFTIMRNNEEKTINHKISIVDNKQIIGIGVQVVYKIDSKQTAPRFKINNTRTQGPSGGLMQAIAIYNSLTETDITKGKIIMGTGTVDLDGNVGIIGGIKQKIITANLYNADYFFVPNGNYKEALEQYNLLDEPTFELINVSTFVEALSILKDIN